jgi:hypothetical protein
MWWIWYFVCIGAACEEVGAGVVGFDDSEEFSELCCELVQVVEDCFYFIVGYELLDCFVVLFCFELVGELCGFGEGGEVAVEIAFLW